MQKRTTEDASVTDGPANTDREGKARLQRLRSRAVRFGEATRRADQNPKLRTAVQRIRAVLPGDAHFGDPMSLGGSQHTEFAGRALVELTGNRPGVARELGLGGLQVWQALLERMGAGSGEHEVTLVFTDLVEFSRWAVRVGDDEVLRVLRAVSNAWEKPVLDRGGTVVKRLGDGMMAAFADPNAALDAVLDGRSRLAKVSTSGWKPRMRAGLHIGKPRRVGGDYLGVSVNTAARLGERAKADEILVSGDLLERLDQERLIASKKRFGTKLKGAPDGLTIHSVEPR
jgi:adenylate cyclase